MTVRFPSTGLNGVFSSLFTHGQLRQVLSAYAEGVLTKHWKDYAICCDKDQTTFCVVDRGHGAPMAAIYSISRNRGQKGHDYFRVFEGDKQVHQCDHFLEALQAFRELGKTGQKKGKLKIIS